MRRAATLALLLAGCQTAYTAKAQHTASFPRTWDEGPAPAPHGKLAVLELRRSVTELSSPDVRYLSDVVRGALLKAAPALDVMTRENLLVLLRASGKDLADCEGECEVDTGRLIGADLVISGEVLKVGSRFKVSLKLHDTRDGRLLATAVADGQSVDELDDGVQRAAAQLFDAR